MQSPPLTIKMGKKTTREKEQLDDSGERRVVPFSRPRKTDDNGGGKMGPSKSSPRKTTRGEESVNSGIKKLKLEY
jgi:hypothetical protein